jgi:hypothetical protein
MRRGDGFTRYANECALAELCFGGADGIVHRLLKKTEEKPLNSGVYCHLLIPQMSLGNPFGFFGRPYNAPFWQQLATVSPNGDLANRGRSDLPQRLHKLPDSSAWCSESITCVRLRRPRSGQKTAVRQNLCNYCAAPSRELLSITSRRESEL